jgi:hypothetical protein
MERIKAFSRDSTEREDEDEEPLNPIDRRKRALNSVFGLRHWEHNLGNKPQSPSIQVETTYSF